MPKYECRLDSLGYLIQGDDKCGAVCFDGVYLLLATNDQKRSRVLNSVIRYLIFLAQDMISYKEKKYEDVKEILKHGIYEKMREEVINEAKKTKKFNQDEEYEKRFRKCLNKVTRAIIYAHFKPGNEKAFPEEIFEALQNKKIYFLDKSCTKTVHSGVHAELKIVQYLLDQGKLDISKKYYIGVSKRCCRNCEKAIEAVDSVKKGSLREHVLNVRDEGHGYSFRADVPLFLTDNYKIREKFFSLMKRRDLEAIFDEGPGGNVAIEEQVHSLSSDDITSESPKHNKIFSKRIPQTLDAKFMEHLVKTDTDEDAQIQQNANNKALGYMDILKSINNKSNPQIKDSKTQSHGSTKASLTNNIIVSSSSSSSSTHQPVSLVKQAATNTSNKKIPAEKQYPSPDIIKLLEDEADEEVLSIYPAPQNNNTTIPKLGK